MIQRQTPEQNWLRSCAFLPASCPSPSLSSASACSSLDTHRFPLPPPAGSGRPDPTRPSPAGDYLHRQPNFQRPNASRSRRAALCNNDVTEQGVFFTLFHQVSPGSSPPYLGQSAQREGLIANGSWCACQMVGGRDTPSRRFYSWGQSEFRFKLELVLTPRTLPNCFTSPPTTT